jgi:hypothetical protein
MLVNSKSHTRLHYGVKKRMGLGMVKLKKKKKLSMTTTMEILQGW